MKRSTFIKTSCTAYASLLLGAGVMSLLESCAPLPVFKPDGETKVLKIPKEKFLKMPLVIIRVNWLPYDVLLVKKSETEYKAIYMKCSHQDQILVASKSGFFCAAHGSTFDLDGNVTKEPAINPLTTFNTIVQSDFIEVHLN